MTLSKSEYMMFLKHPAWLWLKKHAKHKLPEADENLQALFDEGNLFESYAQKLFPHAVELGYKTRGNFDGNKYNSLPEVTKKELEKGTEVIFQGRFEVDNITAIFDVLERVSNNTYDLYEIKSSTSVKSEHIPDLAFQTIVLEKSGLKIRNLYVIHVNNKYVRKGDIDAKKLASKKEDVTEDVRAIIDETVSNIDEAFKIIAMKNMPDTSARHLKSGSMEEWLEIYKMVNGEFPKHCTYNLCGLTAEKVGLLEDMGVNLMKDIPHDFELTERQQGQVAAVKTGEQKINKKEISNFLNTFEYPLHFFDYETFAGVIPAFDGLRPYQQVPFQYSLHILDKPGGKVIHKEYLHTENSNPVPALVKKMTEDFEGKGTVIVWHESFEKARNKEMAEMLPEYEAFLLNINDRILDLKIPFSEGWFTDADFFGSASLKAVSPVLIDKPSYKDLEISNGVTAQRIWMEIVFQGKNKEIKDKIMEDMRKYCGLDTEIMVHILKVLESKI
jgi:hypothetical protein